ncbi:MAG TPA: PorV/PorQ family protein, partial [Candidatus Marinimicrobia bacterium]|nr:PorV/PorQ family protein [Candidatus Neomarinimicrobiota bacterium]
MKRISLLIISLLVFASFVYAQGLLPSLGGQRAATSAFSFLKINPSARAGGLGHAFVAAGGDASIVFWNPAGVIQLNRPAFSVSHLEWFTDIQYDYAAIAIPVSPTDAIALSAGILHMKPMEITTEYLPYGSGEYFSFTDIFAAISYSKKMSDRFSFGVTGKYVQESYLDLTSSGLLLEIGTYYWIGYKDLRIGVSLLNFGSPVAPDGSYMKTDLDGNTYEATYEEFSPPTSFQLGTAMTVYESNFINWLLAFQLNHPVDNAENYVFATELTLLKSLNLRAGYDISQDVNPLS